MELTTAKTILRQLGGNRFLAMTGTKNLTGSETALSMKLARNKSGATHLRVTLDPSDTYTMEFIRVHGVKCSTVRVDSGVYCDQLQDVFTSTTGMYTRL
jgi:hypothetical protein